MTEWELPRRAKRGREIFERRYAPPPERESAPPRELGDDVDERTRERHKARHRTAAPWTEKKPEDR